MGSWRLGPCFCDLSAGGASIFMCILSSECLFAGVQCSRVPVPLCVCSCGFVCLVPSGFVCVSALWVCVFEACACNQIGPCKFALSHHIAACASLCLGVSAKLGLAVGQPIHLQCRCTGLWLPVGRVVVFVVVIPPTWIRMVRYTLFVMLCEA